MAQLTIQQAFDLASQHHHAGRLPEAEQLYRQILALQPEHIDALYNLGAIALRMGRNDDAADLIRRAISLRANFPEAYCDLGIALKRKGQLDEAIAAYRQAIALRPNYAEAQSNLGIALRQKGQLDEAITVYQQAIALRPNFPEVHSNLGNALKDKGQLDEAIAAHRQAIALRPNYAEAYCNLGNALREKGQLDEAISAYRHAIGLKPNYAKVYSNLGTVLDHKGELDEAIATYRKALELNPDLSEAHSNLIFAMHYHPAYSAEAIAEEHRRWNHQHAEPLRKLIQPHTNNRDPDRRLRIGYVSPDFREHPVGRFLLPLLEHHDRKQFEVFCYANVPRFDEITASLRSQADHWREISGLTDDQAAEQIRADGIDILVDLAGHTSGNSLLIFARRPSPVQVTYLGYPNTTGMTVMDYRLSDPLADPLGMTDPFTAEKLWRLPACAWSYQLTDEMPDIQPRPSGPIVFGCLNNFSKVNPTILELWAKVLANNAGSRMLMLAPRSDARQSVLKAFENLGVDPARIELLDRLHRKAYLQTFNRIDVSLDTYPYHGTMTTCESLWMGVPAVSLAGRTHVSRVGVSLLTNVGLGELVAESAEQYVRIATELAHDEIRLSQLRSTLRETMRQSPLMNAKRHAVDIENAYRQMWRTWCETASA